MFQTTFTFLDQKWHLPVEFFENGTFTEKPFHTAMHKSEQVILKLIDQIHQLKELFTPDKKIDFLEIEGLLLIEKAQRKFKELFQTSQTIYNHFNDGKETLKPSSPEEWRKGVLSDLEGMIRINAKKHLDIRDQQYETLLSRIEKIKERQQKLGEQLPNLDKAMKELKEHLLQDGREIPTYFSLLFSEKNPNNLDFILEKGNLLKLMHGVPVDSIEDLAKICRNASEELKNFSEQIEALTLQSTGEQEQKTV